MKAMSHGRKRLDGSRVNGRSGAAFSIQAPLPAEAASGSGTNSPRER